MDNDLFEKGLAQRKATLGAEYVEKNLAAADDFTRPFQEAMTAWCWGFGWGDGVSKEEIRAIIHVVGIYCGVPQSLECFRIARKVLEEDGQL